MICCKECLELLHDYLEGKLSQNIRTSLEEHLEDCPPCIAFFNTYKSTTQICQSVLKETEIPDIVKEKLKEFVEKNKKD